MEEKTMLNQILLALKDHGDRIDRQFNEVDQKLNEVHQQIQDMNTKFEKRFDEMDKRFDRLETKVDGIRMDLTDTQRTSNYLLRKVAEHDEKLLKLTQQHS